MNVKILSVSGGVPSVAWEGNNFPKPKSPKTLRVSRSIKIADLQSLEEGTYFLKVDGYDADGALVTTSRRIDAADPNSRTFLVKLDLPGTTGLRAGQFGRVAMPVGETTALRVPTSAVTQRGQMELVFIVRDLERSLVDTAFSMFCGVRDKTPEA